MYSCILQRIQRISMQETIQPGAHPQPVLGGTDIYSIHDRREIATRPRHSTLDRLRESIANRNTGYGNII